MQQFSNHDIAELRSRIDQIHALLAARGPEADGGPDVPTAAAANARLLDQLAFHIQIRRLRKGHFGDEPLSGPTWDMMLDLMIAQTSGRNLSASDLATGAGVPLSSGLRMIAALERLGLAHRSIDDRDRRRSLVRLTEKGIERMASYFEEIALIRQTRKSIAM